MSNELNWGEVPGVGAGDKIAAGVMATRAKVTQWHCPACGQDNISIFEEGCPACGANTGATKAKHVGADPRVEQPWNPQQRSAQVEQEPSQAPTGDAESAFVEFVKTLPAGLDRKIIGLLFQAFTAGATWGKSQAVSRVDQLLVAAPTPVAGLTGTKEQRTLIAALNFFKEQLLINNPEEVRAGEWCSANEVDQLISQIEGRR